MAPHFAGFEDPYLRLEPPQVEAQALSAGLQVLSSHTPLESWDFGSRAALFDFCSAGFGAWTQRLREDRRDAFVGTVLDR